jgi:hypothetical protein
LVNVKQLKKNDFIFDVVNGLDLSSAVNVDRVHLSDAENAKDIY